MSETLARPELSTFVHVREIELPELIAELLREHDDAWEGTATQLAALLHVNLTPRALSQWLNQSAHELENNGIVITRVRKGDRRLLTLSYAHVPHANEATLRHGIQTTSGDTDANLEGPICFPFRWAYGTVTPLSDVEKAEVNRERCSGRKQYHKPCSLCGDGGGKLAFRKESDRNRCLICRACAEQYVRDALRLQERIVRIYNGGHLEPIE